MKFSKVAITDYWSELVEDSKFYFSILLTRAEVLKDLKVFLRRQKFPRKAQIAYLTDYSSFLKTGSGYEAVKSIIAGVEEAHDSVVKKLVSLDIKRAIDEGDSASDGVKLWFDKDIVEIFIAGEACGQLEDTIKMFVHQQANLAAFKKTFMAGIFMPLVYFLIGLCAAYGLGTSDFLGFPNMIPVEKWPSVAQLAYSYSAFVYDKLFLIMAVIFITKILFTYSARNVTGKLRQFLDYLPPYKVFKAFSYLHALKLITLIKSTGAGDKEALEITDKNSSPYVRFYTEKMLEHVNDGEQDLSKAMDVGLLPSRLMSRLHAVSRASGKEAKTRALQLTTEEGEHEAGLTLQTTRRWLIICTWALTISTLALVIIGIMTVNMAMSDVNNFM